jgi:hypothetical protein
MIYNEGDRVKFDNGASAMGTGIIRGVATEGGPIIGRGYIVEILSAPAILKSIYPYSCIQVFECHLKKDETPGNKQFPIADFPEGDVEKDYRITGKVPKE